MRFCLFVALLVYATPVDAIFDEGILRFFFCWIPLVSLILPFCNEEDGGDGCELLVFSTETFVVRGATLFLAPDTSPTNQGDPKLPATVFIFEPDNAFAEDGVTSINTVVSGTCTRTAIGSNGVGICHFVFTFDGVALIASEEESSIKVSGSLQGLNGGDLAVTGGTGGLLGAVGDLQFNAIYETAAPDDIFIDARKYRVVSDIRLLVCA